MHSYDWQKELAFLTYATTKLTDEIIMWTSCCNVSLASSLLRKKYLWFCPFKVPLGIIFKNENVNEDMLAILHQFHAYLPSDDNGEMDSQHFSGDQLTIERAVNVVASVANGCTSEDCLGEMNFQIGDWHAKYCL